MPFTDAGLAGVQTERDGGGLGNSWGPGEEAGFPGGDTGPLTWSPQAYLSTRTNPPPTTMG